MLDDRTARRRVIALHTIGTLLVSWFIVNWRHSPTWGLVIPCVLAIAYAIWSRGDRVALGLLAVVVSLLLAGWWGTFLFTPPRPDRDVPFQYWLAGPIFGVAFIAEWLLRKRTHAASAVAIAALMMFVIPPISDVSVPSNEALQTMAMLAVFVVGLRVMPDRWWWRIIEPLLIALVAALLEPHPIDWPYFTTWYWPFVVMPILTAILLSPSTLFAWSKR